jgi:hypothetical protein
VCVRAIVAVQSLCNPSEHDLLLSSNCKRCRQNKTGPLCMSCKNRGVLDSYREMLTSHRSAKVHKTALFDQFEAIALGAELVSSALYGALCHCGVVCALSSCRVTLVTEQRFRFGTHLHVSSPPVPASTALTPLTCRCLPQESRRGGGVVLEEDDDLMYNFAIDSPLVRVLRLLSKRCRVVDAALVASKDLDIPDFSMRVDTVLTTMKRELADIMRLWSSQGYLLSFVDEIGAWCCCLLRFFLLVLLKRVCGVAPALQASHSCACSSLHPTRSSARRIR